MAEASREISETLRTISDSVESTSASLLKLKSLVEDEQTPSEYPHLIKQLLQETGSELPEGVSLLSLKNSSMLSYLNSLVLVILSNIERLEANEGDEQFKESRLRAIKNSIVQRVTLERGVKGLENRLNYQLDKMTRAYDRMLEEEHKAEVTAQTGVEKTTRGGSDDASGDSDDEDDSEAEDATSYRPDASSLMAKAKAQSGKVASTANKSSTSDEKYKPPKISAQLPPTVVDNDSKAETRNSRTRKLQSMEEFIAEQGDTPQSVESIGSTILNNGRGGIKTSRDKAREAEIAKYEEDNFVRLNPASLGGDKKKKRPTQDPNVFGGEDFSIFNSNRNISESSSRKRKAMTAWDRAKRKQHR